jgi:hypothetical protein
MFFFKLPHHPGEWIDPLCRRVELGAKKETFVMQGDAGGIAAVAGPRLRVTMFGMAGKAGEG